MIILRLLSGLFLVMTLIIGMTFCFLPLELPFSAPLQLTDIKPLSFTEGILISFSEPMKKAPTENSIKLFTPYGQVSKYFYWESEKTLRVIPEEPQYHSEYLLTVSNRLKSKSGKILPLGIKHTLYFELEETYLNAEINVDHNREYLDINFSAPIIPGSFYHAFTISPNVAGAFEWSEIHDQVIFHPITHFHASQEYSIHIGLGVKSIDGSKLENDLSYIIQKSDSSEFKLNKIISDKTHKKIDQPIHTIKDDEGLILFFSGVAPSSMSNLYITPYIQHALAWNSERNEALLSFSQPPNNNVVYTIHLLEKSYLFTGELFLGPSLSEVRFSNHFDPETADIDIIKLNDTVIIEESEKACFELTIEHDLESTISWISFVDNFRILTSNRIFTHTYLDIKALGPVELENNRRQTTFQVFIAISPETDPGTCTIYLGSGLKDSKGNTMTDYRSLTFNAIPKIAIEDIP